MAYAYIALTIIGAWVLAFANAPLTVWLLIVALALGVVTVSQASLSVPLAIAWVVLLVIGAIFAVPPVRRRLISDRLYPRFRKVVPPMSSTEREALEAGTVWWEGELFGGRPHWKRLLSVPPPKLTPEERAFLDGPVEELCRLVDDWDITHVRRDLPPEVWAFLKRHRFFGMIIPKRYDGLEFSALAHSEVVMKLASRSVTAAVTVMVPNSLGPAELLLHYGTDAQKDYYLPRLARGEEIPCFALTGPEAGSDASAMPDYGIVARGQFEGREVIGIRLTWEKRYITLGPVATVLGLAFKLYDPERLLGGEVERGITLALIPTTTPGVVIGERHNPLDIPFQNGPNSGRDVFVPLEWIIGGKDYIGQGWRMLVERLAVGRGISLPALSTGSGKLASRATGAYARVRRQFKVPIGRFEGVEEVLARIAGQTYLMDAARTLTVAGIDLGEQPAVVSAIVKYHLTERMRLVVNDAMDIQGGSGICLGPRNFMGRGYQGLPISITVEGANILTRSLIIYGQGAIRCHPYLFKEVQAVASADTERGRVDFDRALFGHIGFFISRFARALWLSLTGGRLAFIAVRGPARRYAGQLHRLSAAFAFASELAIATLGGSLKRREKLSGRLADALSLLYLGSAAVKRFEDHGRPAEDLPLLAWACEDTIYRTEQALVGLLRNFPSRLVAAIARLVIFPFGPRARPPSDRLGADVGRLLLAPSAARDRLTAGIFVPGDRESAVGRIEHALPLVVAAESIERKLQGVGEGEGVLNPDAVLEAARAQGLISEEEANLVREARIARRAVIMVDAFAPSQF
ncbi:acyl-CoA dehydrogenase [Sulfurifustis variabilis]|uniref:Acyl-coenzyme A dehydrogenase n=1 Tax=Sulfurifustis variabilis TaxID=1675686 RepID=A0A1C7AG14_9GAMM|nr:acyl-CoA dehydrogenase [Sulfurifustis variabilis]BAU50392.1 acyl-CoA dehydrogenase [Sulfurifustis variabilis]